MITFNNSHLYNTTMKLSVLFSLLFISLLGNLNAQIPIQLEAKNAINAVMQAQEEFWNQGDIDGFMEGYWNHPELVYVGNNGPTYGYQSTLENYKKGYPNKEAMGELHFDILHLQQWDASTVQLIGKFTLIRKNDQPTGYFTLLFRKFDKGWKIVSDHSSAKSLN